MINLNLTHDQMDGLLESLAKARAITQLASNAITAHIGVGDGAMYSDSLWAACDELDKIKGILVPKEATP